MYSRDKGLLNELPGLTNLTLGELGSTVLTSSNFTFMFSGELDMCKVWASVR